MPSARSFSSIPIFLGMLSQNSLSPLLSIKNLEGWSLAQEYTKSHIGIQSFVQQKDYIPTLAYDKTSEQCCIADATIVNRKSLLECLALKNVETHLTDSQLILYAYQKWGIDCVHKLQGDFD